MVSFPSKMYSTKRRKMADKILPQRVPKANRLAALAAARDRCPSFLPGAQRAAQCQPCLLGDKPLCSKGFLKAEIPSDLSPLIRGKSGRTQLAGRKGREGPWASLERGDLLGGLVAYRKRHQKVGQGTDGVKKAREKGKQPGTGRVGSQIIFWLSSSYS
ncbi:hypothetical protein JD844_003882 [Phrynosoma platyrhinos]|uniref:Uncharacterized protein n=1 Tax=Phrynosoma platyrhinos TaxID=52577 RepID=A0ABQ7TEA2_PHRPL|nr:hypothetical protein JD844_003882 [Phrynosoma platyrhinos]